LLEEREREKNKTNDYHTPTRATLCKWGHAPSEWCGCNPLVGACAYVPGAFLIKKFKRKHENTETPL